MKMFVLKLCAFVCLFVCASSQNYEEREEQGYPTGLMSVCPGSTKPATIPKVQLKYLLFIVHGRGSRRKYTYWNARHIAKDPRINFKRKTLIFAPGYLDSANLPISRVFSKLYHDLGYNVILLDYQRFASVHYHLASRLMRPVGKHIAQVLAQLTNSGLDPSTTELLGFSLGGHTVSYIAKNYQQLVGRNISRITSLDPSGPCFRWLGKDDRLAPSDADFVQVVHTNMDAYGMAARMGHIDFYINGGEFQTSELNLYLCTSTCSHFRVLPLWVSTLRNPGKFIGIKCNSIQDARDSNCYDEPLETNVMGVGVDVEKQGIYYVSTGKWYPYYLGEKGLDPQYAHWRQVTDINDGNETEIYT